MKICQQLKKSQRGAYEKPRRFYSGRLTNKSIEVRISEQTEEGLRVIDMILLLCNFKTWCQ